MPDPLPADAWPPFPIHPTRLIGRERERVAIAGLLRQGDVRLVTLTGPGGVGKTRLAFAVAASLAPAFPDGAWPIELGALTEPTLVPQAVAAAMGLREQPGAPLLNTLGDTLSNRGALIVLDGCEHLIGACAALAASLLRAGPSPRILATSREPLGIAGETTWPVAPLAVPDPNQSPPLADLAECAAVALFQERAGAALPGFTVTASTGPAVAELCRRLDGLPLAIELAAVWVRTLDLDQILARLDDRFQFLTGGARTAAPRQQTLRGAIAWSYDLLQPDEQRLFDRLAVCAGGFDLAAAEAIGVDDGMPALSVVQRLGRLVEASLVLAEEQRGERRYRLLETLRLYARERLVASGKAEAAYRRHAAHYLALAEAAEPALWGSETTAWLARLETELDNVRSALRWSVGHGEAEVALRLAAALTRFWRLRGHLSEGLRWLEGALTWSAGVAPATRARALEAAGQLARDRGDYTRAETFYDEALGLRRALGERRSLALALNNLGVVAQFRGDHARAEAIHAESLVHFRALGDEQGVALTLLTLGVMAHLRGERASATAWGEEALEVFRRLGDRYGMAAALTNLGNLASARGDLAAAETLHAESLERFRALDERREVVACLRNLAGIARDRGDAGRALARCRESLALAADLSDAWGVAAGLAFAAHLAAGAGSTERAIALFGAAASALAEAEGGPAAHLAGDEATLTALAAAVGADRFGAAWTDGQAMSRDDAIALVGSADSRPTAVGPVTRSPGGLSRREHEVASWIRSGRTNREIADTLFVSERTVDKHVEHILAKLGLRSRSQVASWAAEHGVAPASRE